MLGQPRRLEARVQAVTLNRLPERKAASQRSGAQLSAGSSSAQGCLANRAPARRGGHVTTGSPLSEPSLKPHKWQPADTGCASHNSCTTAGTAVFLRGVLSWFLNTRTRSMYQKDPHLFLRLCEVSITGLELFS